MYNNKILREQWGKNFCRYLGLGVWKLKQTLGEVADLMSLEKTSGKIDHVLQSDWSMKMAKCELHELFSHNFSNLCFLCAYVQALQKIYLDTSALL